MRSELHGNCNQAHEDPNGLAGGKRVPAANGTVKARCLTTEA